MARGLSDLQKWMLVRALENAESGMCDESEYYYTFEEVTRAEIRTDYYKFPTAHHWEQSRKSYSAYGWSDRKWIRGIGARSSNTFVKSEIPNYAAVNLAITRAHDRLRKRGLATDQVGFWLTDKGREVAKLLAVPADDALSGTANNSIGSPSDHPTVRAANTKMVLA